MKLFSRASDILNSNINAMLDKAENPEKMVRAMIAEMEGTLFEVRRESAATINSKKKMERNLKNLQQEIETWQQRAEKALARDREDLAKLALVEKHRVEEACSAQQQELAKVEHAVERLDHDISRLQSQLDQAIARRDAILLRHRTVVSTVNVRRFNEDNKIEKALGRFEQFEARIDQLESELEAMELGQNPGLAAQIDNLEKEQALQDELEALKQKVKKAS